MSAALRGRKSSFHHVRSVSQGHQYWEFINQPHLVLLFWMVFVFKKFTWIGEKRFLLWRIGNVGPHCVRCSKNSMLMPLETFPSKREALTQIQRVVSEKVNKFIVKKDI